jgi:transposase
MNTESASPRLRAIDRNQLILRPIDVEQLIPEDHAARALWEFTSRLNLTRFYEGIRAVEGHAGQPGWDPRLLIAVWLYGYSRGIGSAREISRMCEHEPGLQWLCGMEAINHHSLSDFRVEHDAALKDLFTQVLGVLSAEGLITLERVTLDGTRIRAWASGNTFRREATLREHLKLAEQQVQAMGDPRQPVVVNKRIAQARKRAARDKQERLKRALEQLEKVRGERRSDNREEARASETDPDARVMKRAGGGFEPAYNVQLTTDAAAGVIVGLQVTQSGADAPQLQPAMEQIQECFGRVPPQVVTDSGYASRENIVAMHGRSELICPVEDYAENRYAGQQARWGVADEFTAEHFVYDAEQDLYQCPAGKQLPYYKIEPMVGGRARYYRADPTDCRKCPHKAQCCPKVPSRRIRQVTNDPAIVEHRARMETAEARQIYRQRAQLAEFPNAWIKSKIKLRQFQLRGRVKVTMETLWAALTYNIQQWIRLRWRAGFEKATVS